MSRRISRRKGNGYFLTLPSYRAGLELTLWNPQAEKNTLPQSHPIYLQVAMCPCHLSKKITKKQTKSHMLKPVYTLVKEDNLRLLPSYLQVPQSFNKFMYLDFSLTKGDNR